MTSTLSATIALALAAAPVRPDRFLERYVATRRFAAGRPAQAQLTPDGKAAVFLRSGPRSPVQALFETDLASGETRELATADGLLAGHAASITAEEQAQLERKRITARGITGYEMSRDGRRLLVTVGGLLFLLERGSGEVKALAASGRPLDARFAPDGKTISYAVDHDLRLLDLSTNRERPLTTGGTEDVPHGIAEFIAQEELGRFEGHWWSPDSSRIAYQETDQREVERFTIHDPLHPERPAHVVRYPRAGTANARVRVGVIPAAGGATTWIAWDRERFPYLAGAGWAENGPLWLLVLNRRQTELRLLAADPASGATQVLLEERDSRWVYPPPGTVHEGAGCPRWLPDGSGFFWTTEQRGRAEVELRAADGRLRGTWVRPEHGFAGLVGYDAARGWLWFTGGPNPTESHLFVSRRGEAPQRFPLPPGPQIASAMIARESGDLLVTRITPAGFEAPVAYRPDGRRLASLPCVAEDPPFATRIEIRKVGPGEGFWTSIIRPRAFQRGRKLPVLVWVYGGPTGREVLARPRLLDQWMADQGYLVVAVDGRGTPGRGREWERAVFGDLAGPPLEDQVAGLRALARKVPEMDLRRVGIWGWSFGGYMAALAVLRRPDVFRAAVAGAPVVEWRDYDTAYSERYLGLPAESAEAYDRSSLLTDARDLRRPLLLVHGSADDNVYPFHSLKLADALFRAGHPCELLLLPGQAHGALASTDEVLVRRTLERIMGFFRANL